MAPLYSERTNLSSALTAVVAGGIGIGLLYLATILEEFSVAPSIFTVIRQLGGLFVVSTAVGVLWQLRVRRVFLSEILQTTQLAEEIRDSGIVKITSDYNREIDWPELFKNVRELDVFFSYGQTWRSSNVVHLRKLSETDAQIRIVLPDPDDNQIMAELARRFQIRADEVRQRVRDSAEDFIKIFGKSKATFSLWYLPESPVFTMYRFDHRAILALYKHRHERGEVPTFMVQKGGLIYDFLVQDFEAFVAKNGLGRCVYPNPP